MAKNGYISYVLVFYIGDRYNKDPNRSPHSDGYAYNSNDDFRQRSRFQQIKETIDNIRPGKRDYSEYNTPTSR